MTIDPDRDFRSERIRLPKESFLIHPDEDPEPSDLISKETWRELVWLADDTSIRTSDHHGSILRDANEMYGHWLTLVLDVQSLLDRPRDDALQLATLSAGDEWQASTYAAFTGFYRQAIACLRPAMEGLLAGAYFRAFPDPAAEAMWADGDENARLAPAAVRRTLAKAEPYQHFDHFLTHPGWVETLYGLLSAFQHGRPSHTDKGGRMPTTNVELWGGSNGPVYEERAFMLWARAYFNTMLLSLLIIGLAEPRITEIEKPTELPFIAFLDRLWRAHPEPGVPGVLVPVARYLDPEYAS